MSEYIIRGSIVDSGNWDYDDDSIHISEIAETGIESWEEFLSVLVGNTPTEG